MLLTPKDLNFGDFVTEWPPIFVWRVTERPIVRKGWRHMYVTLKYECPQGTTLGLHNTQYRLD